MTTETEQPEYIINPDLEKLVKLQKVDSNLQRKRALLERLPAELQQAYSSCEAVKKKLADYDAAIEAERKRRRELEAEVETIKDKIAKDKTKLSAIKTNVEYRAMVKELDNYEKKIAALDDEQLLLMEKDEKATEERKTIEAEASKEEEAYAIIKKEKEAAIGEVKTRVGELTAERKVIVEGVTPSVFAKYERILKARDGVGVAEVIEKICASCHQMIQPQLYYNIRTTDELISCPHCSRFLYYDHEAAARDKKEE